MSCINLKFAFKLYLLSIDLYLLSISIFCLSLLAEISNTVRSCNCNVKLFCLDLEGDVKGFTDTYLQALNLQKEAKRCTMSSVSDDMNGILLPHDVYLTIFELLTPKELCSCMSVCKVSLVMTTKFTSILVFIFLQSWYDICMDGQLWYKLYKKKWPVGINLEASINFDKPSLKVCTFLIVYVF